MIDYYKIAAESKASQDKFELWQMIEIAVRIQPQRIMEIGVHRGGMLETLRQVFPQAELVGVDIDFNYLQFDDFTKIEGRSQDPFVRDRAIAQFYDPQIDFLFIDGDHFEHSVIADFEMYAPYVRPGGIVAFHDIMRRPGQIAGVEVRKAFDALKLRYASVEIWNGTAGDNGPGIGVLFL